MRTQLGLRNRIRNYNFKELVVLRNTRILRVSYNIILVSFLESDAHQGKLVAVLSQLVLHIDLIYYVTDVFFKKKVVNSLCFLKFLELFQIHWLLIYALTLVSEAGTYLTGRFALWQNHVPALSDTSWWTISSLLSQYGRSVSNSCEHLLIVYAFDLLHQSIIITSQLL